MGQAESTSTTRHIVVMGGVNLDTTYYVDTLPREGETLFSSRQESAIGGKGLNQALAAGRAGAPVELVGMVGADEAGEQIREFLAEEGLGVDSLLVSLERPTGHAAITVDAMANNTIVVAPGANADLDPSCVDSSFPVWRDCAILLANGESPNDAVNAAFFDAKRRGVTTVWNPSPMVPKPDCILRNTDVLAVNESEALDLVGFRDTSAETAVALSELGVEEVLLTLGIDGCIVIADGDQFRIPVLPVNAVDPTAAGDTFLGFYLANRLFERGRDVSAAMAAVAAALCVQSSGASTAIPQIEDVDMDSIQKLLTEKELIDVSAYGENRR